MNQTAFQGVEISMNLLCIQRTFNNFQNILLISCVRMYICICMQKTYYVWLRAKVNVTIRIEQRSVELLFLWTFKRRCVDMFIHMYICVHVQNIYTKDCKLIWKVLLNGHFAKKLCMLLFINKYSCISYTYKYVQNKSGHGHLCQILIIPKNL